MEDTTQEILTDRVEALSANKSISSSSASQPNLLNQASNIDSDEQDKLD